VTKHNSEADRIEAMVQELHQQLDGTTHSSIPSDRPSKRGRPITAMGAAYREIGWSRLKTWKTLRMGEIPEEQFEAYLDDPSRTARELGLDAILRHFSKLSPDKPRPRARAQVEAIRWLMAAEEDFEQLNRRLLEVASEEELEMLTSGRRKVARALLALTARLLPKAE
jgi:hypothetical protein